MKGGITATDCSAIEEIFNRIELSIDQHAFHYNEKEGRWEVWRLDTSEVVAADIPKVGWTIV
jgi:hypothetical protein